MIALGARAVVTVGTAGALHHRLHPGDLVISDRALRDEGTSHHYLPPGRYTEPDPTLSQHLTSALTSTERPVYTGGTWTTDALYRETPAEAQRYAAEGLLTVEMEAAAVFAVARHRGIPAAAAFTVADSLVDRQPRADSREVSTGLEQLLDAAVAALAWHGGPARAHYKLEHLPYEAPATSRGIA
ncbi:nucleoside phosphorylase [Streptomyces scopuliridis]|uniref:Nucleoside phosphorylase n=1 Tax=Streptomyces scopuliridis TaxID=452529 RepID=A0ACD4ZTV5_9ACTN|nr:nucleoside phosphorylase [Streptomyces scopuliridis]WSC01728.1 nucleoside phosphorylase [Streptomyces scopuliridis]WSC04733.1 nucleoside phosphorylase [Streptomyces scopuliridis]